MLMGSVKSTPVSLLLWAVTGGVCFAQMPPSESINYAAKVTSMSGRVSVLKDGSEWALGVDEQVQVKQIIVTGPDGHAMFQVSDGSTFEVFPNSSVVFRKNPPNWKDLLDVFVGRVRIHIQHWGNVPNPNRIYTPTAVISVRGTTFEVAVTDDDETTIVEVEEGTVAVQHALLPRGDAKILNSGESIRVYKSEPLEAKVVDKGAIIQVAVRAVVDALYTMVYSGPRLKTGTGTGGSGGICCSGDPKGPTPPPAPAPAPPPPPQ